MMTPKRTDVKVSCIVCTYNYGHFLNRCLHSILEQTMPRESYEVIVVDDGSTDDTSRVLAEWGGSVHVVRQCHRGLAEASNAGVLFSTGEYFIRVDADDELFPDALRLLSQALDVHPEAAAVFADRVEVDETGVEKIVGHSGPLNIYELIAPGIMFKRSLVLEVGLYHPLYWEEHDLMVRLLQSHPIHQMGGALYRYHRHGANMTANSESRMWGWRALIEEWSIKELRKWGHSVELEQAWTEMLSLEKSSL